MEDVRETARSDLKLGPAVMDGLRKDPWHVYLGTFTSGSTFTSGTFTLAVTDGTFTLSTFTLRITPGVGSGDDGRPIAAAGRG